MPTQKSQKNIPDQARADQARARAETVAAMAKNGSTTREIALAVSYSQSGVVKMLRRLGVSPARRRGQRGPGTPRPRPESESRATYYRHRCLFYNCSTGTSDDHTILLVNRVLNRPYYGVVQSILRSRHNIFQAVAMAIANSDKDYYDKQCAVGFGPGNIWHPSPQLAKADPANMSAKEAAGRARAEARALRAGWVATLGPSILLCTLKENIDLYAFQAVQTAGVVNTETQLRTVLGWDENDVTKISNAIAAAHAHYPGNKRRKWITLRELLLAAAGTGVLLQPEKGSYTIPTNTSIFRPLREVLSVEGALEQEAASWAPETTAEKEKARKIVSRWRAANRRYALQCWCHSSRNGDRINRAIAFSAISRT